MHADASDLSDHDGAGEKPGVRRWHCSRCRKVAVSPVEIPVGWYHTAVTTNLPGEGVRNYASFACSRACYDALKIARIDSSRA